MGNATHHRQDSRYRFKGRLLGGFMVLAFMALPFLGSAGCGCGDDRLPIVRDQPAICCCEFAWIPGSNVVDQDVNVTFTSVDPSLHPFAQPPLLVEATAGEFSTFRICVREDHTIGASMRVELRAAGVGTLLGSADLFYNEQCVPGVEPLQDTVIYSTDCGSAVPDCCCTYEWLADLDDEDVVISVVDASTGLNAVVIPSTFTDVENEFVTFSVCVDVDHPLGASLTLEFRDPSGAPLYGSATLTYGARCDPTLTPGVRTTIHSTDCGGGTPLCCCDIEWRMPVDSEFFVDAVRIAFEDVDAGLSPLAIPEVVTGVVNQGFAIFNVCVSEGHPTSAQMSVVLYDNATNEEFARLPVIYNTTCVPTPGDSAGFGTFSVLCEPQLGSRR